MNHGLTELLTFILIGLGVWSCANTVYTGINLYQLIQQCRKKVTHIDAIQFLVSFVLSFSIAFVLFVHPGLIYHLSSGLFPLAVGVSVLLFHVTEYQWKRAITIRYFLSCQKH